MTKNFIKNNVYFINLYKKYIQGGHKMSKSFRPGEVAPESGNYCAFDANGHNGGCCYLQKGQRFPATQHSGSYYMKED